MYGANARRWNGSDRLAEEYYDISPYVYCLNNPINIIDPDGKKIVAANIDAQRMILNTLPKEYRQYVSFDKNRIMNTVGLSNIKSTSGNFNAMRTIASHQYAPGMKDLNKYLFDLINRLMNETVKNMDDEEQNKNYR
jgi:hypothetical protein